MRLLQLVYITITPCYIINLVNNNSSISGSAPAHLSHILSSNNLSQRRKSSDQILWPVSIARLKSYGDCAPGTSVPTL